MRYALFVFALAAALIMIPFSEAACEGAADALRIFAGSMLPSLFPFLVCANMMIRSGGFELMRGRRRLPALMVTCLAAGICGTPSAALLSGELKRSGMLTVKEASFLCGAVNLAGPVFVAVTLAGAFAGNGRLGLPFAAANYAPAIVLTLVFSLVLNKKYGRAVPSINEKKPASAAVFAGAISDSVTAVLRVGGTLVFFRVLYSAAEASGLLSPIPETAGKLIAGCLEMTNGLELLASGGTGTELALCAFVLSFGGLCLFAQAKQIFPELKAGPYFAAKAVSGFMSFLLMRALLDLFPAAAEAASMLSEGLAGPKERASVLFAFAGAFGLSLAASALLAGFAAKNGRPRSGRP